MILSRGRLILSMHGCKFSFSTWCFQQGPTYTGAKAHSLTAFITLLIFVDLLSEVHLNSWFQWHIVSIKGFSIGDASAIVYVRL